MLRMPSFPLGCMEAVSPESRILSLCLVFGSEFWNCDCRSIGRFRPRLLKDRFIGRFCIVHVQLQIRRVESLYDHANEVAAPYPGCFDTFVLRLFVKLMLTLMQLRSPHVVCMVWLTVLFDEYNDSRMGTGWPSPLIATRFGSPIRFSLQWLRFSPGHQS